jgi:hypothetical protein
MGCKDGIGAAFPWARDVAFRTLLTLHHQIELVSRDAVISYIFL